MSLRPARLPALARVAAAAPIAVALVATAALPSFAGANPAGHSAGKAATSASSASVVSETGTLVELVADDFAHGVARKEWALQQGRDYVALRGVEAADVAGLVGRRVQARGKAVGRHALALDDGSITAAAGSTASTDSMTAATAGTAQAYKRVAVVMVNFTDDPQQPVTADQVRTTMFGSATDVDAHFQDSSGGRLGVQGDVFGWYTVERISGSSCDYSAWGNAARTAATASGVDLSGYEHVMYFWPQQSACSWAGLGQLPGSTTWINGSNTTRVLAHELSHNLGEHHASAAGSCVEDGVSVIIPAATSSCTVSEYGDAFTIMGSSSYYLHSGAARSHWGWLAPVTAVAGEPGTWTLVPIDAGATEGTRLVRIPRGDGSYLTLEHRQPQGVFDTFSTTAPVATGVTLRLDHGVGTRQTVLFDANPATATYGDAPLGVGRSVTDPLSGVTITVRSVTSAGAQVSVSYGGPTDPGTDPTDPGTDPTTPPPPSDTTAPTAVGRLKASVRKGDVSLTWRAASDDSGAVEYQVTRTQVTARTSATRWTDRPGAGSWVYTVVATDEAGNASAPAQVAVSVGRGNATDGGGGKGGKGKPAKG